MGAIIPNNRAFTADNRFLVYGSVVFGNEGQKPDPENPGTLKQIFIDQEETTPAQNPQPLDGDAKFQQGGSTGKLFGSGIYSVLVLDSNGVEQAYMPSYSVIDNQTAQEAAEAAEAAQAAAEAAAEDITVPVGASITLAVETIAELRALEPLFDGQQVSLSGYHSTAAPDQPKGGGIFTAKYGNYSAEVSSDTLTGIYVAFPSDPSGATGAWVRKLDANITPESFGAAGDGVTDDTLAAQKMVDSLGYFKGAPGSAYSISTVVKYGDFHVDLNGSTIIHRAGSTDAAFVGGSGRFVILGGTLDGSNISRSNRQWLVKIASGLDAESVVAKDITFKNCSERCISGGVSDSAIILNCEFIDSEGYPVQMTGSAGSSFVCSNNTITFGTAKTTSGDFIRAIQPTGFSSVVVTGNYLNSSRKYRDGVWISGCSHATVAGNTIKEHFDDSVTFVGVCNKVLVSGNNLSGSDATGGVVCVAGSTVKDITITGNVMSDGIRGTYLFGVERGVVNNNVFSGYDYGTVLPLAYPSSNVRFQGNVFHNITYNHLDLGSSNDIEISGNDFGLLTDLASISVIGLNSVRVSVNNNTFHGLAFRAVQTGDADWSVSGNKFMQVPERCISIGDSNGTNGLSCGNNQYIGCDTPVVVVSGKGASNLSFEGGVYKSDTDQTVSGNPAIQLGDASSVVITGGVFKSYLRAAQNAAGSDYVIFNSNDEHSCGFSSASGLGSASNLSTVGNLTP